MFCIFMEMPPKFATAYLDRVGGGGYLIVLPHMSYTHVNFPGEGCISKGSATNVICMCELISWGGISDGSVTNVICTCELQLVGGLSDGSATNVICTCELQLQGGIRRTSENMNSFGFDSCFTEVFSTKDQSGSTGIYDVIVLDFLSRVYLNTLATDLVLNRKEDTCTHLFMSPAVILVFGQNIASHGVFNIMMTI